MKLDCYTFIILHVLMSLLEDFRFFLQFFLYNTRINCKNHELKIKLPTIIHMLHRQ